jgi:hypothetical protein
MMKTSFEITITKLGGADITRKNSVLKNERVLRQLMVTELYVVIERTLWQLVMAEFCAVSVNGRK